MPTRQAMPDITIDDNYDSATGDAKTAAAKKRTSKRGKAEEIQEQVEAANPEDEQEGGKKKKVKLTRAEKKLRRQSGGRRKLRIVLKILFIALPILLVGGFVFEEIHWNWLGVRDWTCDAFISVAIWLDPDTALQQKALSDRSDELDRREQLITAREEERKATLDAKQEKINKREEDVTAREKSAQEQSKKLDERENALKEQQNAPPVPLYRRILTDQELTDMKALSGTYAAMDPEKAAEILEKLGDYDEMAAIIYYMTEKKAAAIISAMDATVAAVLTQKLLYEQ